MKAKPTLPANGGNDQGSSSSGTPPVPGNHPIDDATAKRAHASSITPSNPNRMGVTPSAPPSFNLNAALAAASSSDPNPPPPNDSSTVTGMDMDADLPQATASTSSTLATAAINTNNGTNSAAPRQLELNNLNAIAAAQQSSIPQLISSIPLNQLSRNVLCSATTKLFDCIACPICGSHSTTQWPLHPEQQLFLCNNVYSTSGTTCPGNYTPANMYFAITSRSSKQMTAQFNTALHKQIQTAFFKPLDIKLTNQYQNQLDKATRLREDILQLNTDIILQFPNKIPDSIIKLMRLTQDFVNTQKILNDGLVATLKTNITLNQKALNTGIQIHQSNPNVNLPSSSTKPSAQTPYSKAAAAGAISINNIIKTSNAATVQQNLATLATTGIDPTTNKSIEVRIRKPVRDVEEIESVYQIRNDWVRNKVINTKVIALHGYAHMHVKTFKDLLAQFHIKHEHIVNLRYTHKLTWEVMCPQDAIPLFKQFITLSPGFSEDKVSITTEGWNPLNPFSNQEQTDKEELAAIERLARNSVRPGISSFASLAYQKYMDTDAQRKVYVKFCNQFIDSIKSGGNPANHQ